MNLDGNQSSIHEAIDAGLLAGAVTVVWQAGQVLQVNGGLTLVDVRVLDHFVVPAHGHPVSFAERGLL